MTKSPIAAATLLAIMLSPALPAEEAAPTVDRMAKALVMVVARDADGVVTNHGVGFLLTPGRVICERHLLVEAARVDVISAGRKASEVTVIADDPYWNLALLKADGLPDITSGLPPAESLPAVGEKVFVAVASSDGRPRLQAREVKSVTDIGFGKMARIVGAASDSAGGPLISSEGEVLGFASLPPDKAGRRACLFSADRIPPLQGSKPLSLAKWQERARKGAAAAASDPRCAKAFEALRRGELRDSLRAWREVVELYPNDAEARVWMGMSCLRRSNPRRALGTFEEAVRLAPDSHAANFGLAIAHARMDRLSDAHAALKTLAAQRSGDSRVQLALGIVCERREDQTGASAAYRMALQQEPQLVRFMLRLDPDDSLAWLLASTGTGAVYGGRPAWFFDEALRIHPNWPEALVGRAWVTLDDTYHVSGYKPLLSACHKALELKSHMAEGYYVSALIHHSCQEYDEASAAMKKAVELAPQWPLPHYWLGQRYVEVEDIKSARKHLNALRPFNPDLAEDLDVRIQNLLMLMR